MYGEEKDEVVQLYLDDIIPNRFQPREVFDERALKELAVSIKAHGVIQPIIVRNVNGKYEIIAGERRYKASALAGLTKIPAIIRNLDDKESSKVALLENLQRKNLNAIEEARTYQKILEIDQMTQEELAKTMGKSQSAVANKIRLLSLSEEVQEALLKEQISERHARALLNVKDPKKQKEYLKNVIDTKMSVRKLEAEIEKEFPKAKKADDIPVNTTQEASTTGFLNNSPLMPTSVDVNEDNSNYGKVVIAPPKEDNEEDMPESGKFINYGEIEKEKKEPERPPVSSDIDMDKVRATSQDISKNTTGSDLDGLLNIGDPINPAKQIINDNLIDINPSEDYFNKPDLSVVQIPSVNNVVSEPTSIPTVNNEPLKIDDEEDDDDDEEPTDNDEGEEKIEIPNIPEDILMATQDSAPKPKEPEKEPAPEPKEEKSTLAPIPTGNDDTSGYTVEEAKEKISALIEDFKKNNVKVNADEMDFPKAYQVIIKIEKN